MLNKAGVFHGARELKFPGMWNTELNKISLHCVVIPLWSSTFRCMCFIIDGRKGFDNKRDLGYFSVLQGIYSLTIFLFDHQKSLAPCVAL